MGTLTQQDYINAYSQANTYGGSSAATTTGIAPAKITTNKLWDDANDIIVDNSTGTDVNSLFNSAVASGAGASTGNNSQTQNPHSVDFTGDIDSFIAATGSMAIQTAQNDADITNAYVTIFGRQPDAAGKATYLTEMNKGNLTIDGVKEIFKSSTEAIRNNEVIGLVSSAMSVASGGGGLGLFGNIYNESKTGTSAATEKMVKNLAGEIPSGIWNTMTATEKADIAKGIVTKLQDVNNTSGIGAPVTLTNGSTVTTTDGSLVITGDGTKSTNNDADMKAFLGTDTLLADDDPNNPNINNILATSDNTLAIERLYNDILKRPVGQDGMNTYLSLLNSGQLTETQLKSILENSAEKAELDDKEAAMTAQEKLDAEMATALALEEEADKAAIAAGYDSAIDKDQKDAAAVALGFADDKAYQADVASKAVIAAKAATDAAAQLAADEAAAKAIADGLTLDAAAAAAKAASDKIIADAAQKVIDDKVISDAADAKAIADAKVISDAADAKVISDAAAAKVVTDAEAAQAILDAEAAQKILDNATAATAATVLADAQAVIDAAAATAAQKLIDDAAAAAALLEGDGTVTSTDTTATNAVTALSDARDPKGLEFSNLFGSTEFDPETNSFIQKDDAEFAKFNEGLMGQLTGSQTALSGYDKLGTQQQYLKGINAIREPLREQETQSTLSRLVQSGKLGATAGTQALAQLESAQEGQRFQEGVQAQQYGQQQQQQLMQNQAGLFGLAGNVAAQQFAPQQQALSAVPAMQQIYGFAEEPAFQESLAKQGIAAQASANKYNTNAGLFNAAIGSSIGQEAIGSVWDWLTGP